MSIRSVPSISGRMPCNISRSPLRLLRRASAMPDECCCIRVLFWMVLVSSSSGGGGAFGLGIGVCYGRQGSDLPSPDRVVQLLTSQTLVTKVRLLAHDADVMAALANAQVPHEVVIGIPNAEIPGLARGQAQEWANTVVAAALAAGTNVVALAMGSEVMTAASPDVAPLLLPAMKNMYAALVQMGAADRVKLSSPVSMSVLSTSFPPSSAVFSAEMEPLLDFLSQTGSYLMANVYPYYAYRGQRQHISLDYALLRPNAGFTDPNTGLHYWNMFDAQLDALYYAMAALGHPELGVIVTETGWPSTGDLDEVDVVNPENAAAYNGNLVRHLLEGDGTPLRRGLTVDTYLYELFNEDLKAGPTSHQNWGLFAPDGSKLYDIPLTLGSSSSSRSSFCVANPEASFASLQAALDWACGPGQADCTASQPGNSCYLPDSIQAHASYAFNDFYQTSGLVAAACSFAGAALITSIDPSYGACHYRGRRSILFPGKAPLPPSKLIVPLLLVLSTL